MSHSSSVVLWRTRMSKNKIDDMHCKAVHGGSEKIEWRNENVDQMLK